jgi:DNA-binding response OmpR family regulator/Tfp pilus assembly protein PilF
MADIDYANKRFLVIDNIKQSRDMLKIFAYSLGAIRVDTNHHAPDIMQMCANAHYDVILLGYDLGDKKKNGQQILEELRVKQLIPRQCIIIMITAEVSQAMVLAALEHKPDEYLAKPYTLDDLSTRIERCFLKKSAMSAIYDAMDNENFQKVLSLCETAINENSPYKNECLGIKSRQHFELAQFDQAKEIYSGYLGGANCQWAAIGLGKICLAEKDYTSAINYFKAVIESHPFYLSAYDWLAKAYQFNNEPNLAEDILEKALVVSPRSVSRLTNYADLCVSNENFDKATSAFSKTTELAYHSIHKKPDHALQFVEALLEYSDNLTLFQIRKLNNKAFKALSDMVKDFSSAELKIYSQLLTARLHTKAQETNQAKEIVKSTERLLKRVKTPFTNKGTLSIAESLLCLNSRTDAHKLLSDLAQANPDDTNVLADINALTNNPINESDKLAAQTALEIGNNLYRAKHYTLAIDKLNKALTHFPNHIGIKLNLLQVLLVSIEKNSYRKKDQEQAQQLIAQFKYLSVDSESYNRFVKLHERYKLIYKSFR